MSGSLLSLYSRRAARLFLLIIIVAASSGCAADQNVAASADVIAPVRTIPATAVATATEKLAPSPVPPTPVATSTAAAALATPQPLQNAVDPNIADVASSWESPVMVLDGSNTGYWQFASGTFLHPIALEIHEEAAYMIDGGRVLQIALDQPAAPLAILSPGDSVEGVLVIEPLDLAQAGGDLFVLDRAGDVYRYDIGSRQWSLDRYDRPVEASSGNYFVAVDAEETSGSGEVTGIVRGLLETNYKYVQLYGDDVESLWNLEERRSVDLRMLGDNVYVLQRDMHDLTGTVTLFRDTSTVTSFRPRFPIEQPRQMATTPAGLLVLDKGGQRIVDLQPDTGDLVRLLQPPQDEVVTAVAYDSQFDSLVLAGRDRLYFVGRPQQLAAVAPDAVLNGLQADDTLLLDTLFNFIVPIGGSNISFRDFQMPGAPRHYRLGVHNGMDLYWQPGTKVLAAGDGVITRADTDYVPATAAELAAWAADSAQRGYTSAENLDNYMGRQVWIEHAPGIVTRYAHLQAIEPGIEVGAPVTRGQVIGEVGNSGSPASLEGEAADAHLHFELWLGDTHLGQFLRPIETREIIERMFPPSR